MTLLSFAAAAAAQTQPTPGAPAPQPQLDVTALLKSPDPRLQAWGAWYAGTGHMRHRAADTGRRPGAALRRRPLDFSLNGTLDIALDALIQLQAPIEAAWLPEVYAVRPAQALIVASLAGEDADDFLRDVMHRAKGLDWFAAANILLARNPRALVVPLLGSLRLKVKVFVVDDGHMMGSGGGGAAGVGCGSGGLAPGLPPWADYGLTSSVYAGVTVLATGPTPVYYRRTVAPAGRTPSGSTVFLDGPTGDDRLNYVAAAVGIDLPVRGYEQHSVTVKDGSSLDSELTRIRTDLSVRYRRFIHTLIEQSLLPADAAGWDLPPIDLEVEDYRRTAPANPEPAAVGDGDGSGAGPAVQVQQGWRDAGSATRVPGDDAVVRASRPDRPGDPLARATPIRGAVGESCGGYGAPAGVVGARGRVLRSPDAERGLSIVVMFWLPKPARRVRSP